MMRRSKFEPPNGKCYSGTGQSMVAMVEMMHKTDGNRKPVIFALYDAIHSPDYVIHSDILEAHNLFPGGYLQIGLAFPLHNDKALEELGRGIYDEALIQLVRTYKSIQLPIFVRLGYEFDGPWNGYSPELYIKAYRHVVDVFREEQADNIAFVWNTYICDNKEIYKWFPHDEKDLLEDNHYIDWFAFNTVTAKFEADWFMEQAKIYNKPVMIGEASYAIINEGVSFEEWLESFFTMIQHYKIQGYQYINWDWSVYPEVTNWLDWACGRYTMDKEKVDRYNRYLDDCFVYRDHEYAQPVKLFVHCARGLREADAKGITWGKEKDHYTMEDGYDYAVAGAELAYGDGWKPYWKSVEGGMSISITLPEKASGYVILDLLDYIHNEPLTITTDKETYTIRNKGNGYIKVPINNIEDGVKEIPIHIAFKKGYELKLHQLGFVEVALDIEPVTDLHYSKQDEKIIIQWKGVQDAYSYNIYVDYWLYAVTDEQRYTLEGFDSGTHVSVSPVSQTKGEGVFKSLMI